ncbi:hypothetical protein JCM10212_001805 [Sporobolomyces blumeae]
MDLVPEPSSLEFSQSQFTQTQPQTQPDTQNDSTAFPSHLWGILLLSSGESTSTSLVQAHPREETRPNARANANQNSEDRPTRVEFVRSAFGGKSLYTIGRHPRSDVRLNSIKVSSNHAKIWASPVDGLVRLEDLSTNGTFVRGVKVGRGKITILEPGDSIIFGPASVDFGNDFRYVFQCPPTNSTSADPYGLGELSQSASKVFSEYEVREQIGKGSFASVRKGVRRRDGTMVAIKIIQKARFANNPKTLEMFSREIEIIQQLDHQYCVKCYDWYEDEARLWIVLEYVDGGDLLDYTMKKKGLSERETREIAAMVCQAVAYLHSRGITHRDLKPENLLLTKGAKPVCKVTDFGLAKMVTDQTMLKTMCGTPTYLAPEVILNPNPSAGYSPLVDAWSIGVVLFSLLTCQTPFDESESTPLPQRMRERQVDFEFLRGEGLSEVCLDFLRRLLVSDPRKRMSCAEALAHPWIAPLPLANSTNSMSASSLLGSSSFYPSRQGVASTVPASKLVPQNVSSSPIDSTTTDPSRDDRHVGENGHKPVVAGLMSAISLDQSPVARKIGNDEVGDEESFVRDKAEESDGMVDSQAIGNLRLSHPSSPSLSTRSFPAPPLPSPPPAPVDLAPRSPSPPRSENVVAGLKRKHEPESFFSDSSLSQLASSSGVDLGSQMSVVPAVAGAPDPAGMNDLPREGGQGGGGEDGAGRGGEVVPDSDEDKQGGEGGETTIGQQDAMMTGDKEASPEAPPSVVNDRPVEPRDAPDKALPEGVEPTRRKDSSRVEGDDEPSTTEESDRIVDVEFEGRDGGVAGDEEEVEEEEEDEPMTPLRRSTRASTRRLVSGSTAGSGRRASMTATPRTTGPRSVSSSSASSRSTTAVRRTSLRGSAAATTTTRRTRAGTTGRGSSHRGSVEPVLTGDDDDADLLEEEEEEEEEEGLDSDRSGLSANGRGEKKKKKDRKKDGAGSEEGIAASVKNRRRKAARLR